MSKVKEEVDLTGEEDQKPAGLDEETKRAFGNELVVPTPVFAKPPFFKVSDFVKCPSPYNSHLIKGYSIKAVAWMDKHEMRVYMVEPIDGKAIVGIVLEKKIFTSRYTVNDIVRFTAFGIVLEKKIFTSRYTVNDIVRFTAFGISNTRTIKEVFIDDKGTSYYAIAGGFRLRDVDIAELVARS